VKNNIVNARNIPENKGFRKFLIMVSI